MMLQWLMLPMPYQKIIKGAKIVISSHDETVINILII